MNNGSNNVAAADRSTPYTAHSFNFQNTSVGCGPSGAAAPSEATSAIPQEIFKNAANPLLAAAANSAYASNKAKDSLLQHMATSFMAANNNKNNRRSMPEAPSGLFDNRNSLDPSSAIAQATAVVGAPTATAVPNTTTSLSRLNAATNASALSASNMLNNGNAFSTPEDLFEPIDFNSSSAFVGGMFDSSSSSNMNGQQDNALSRMLSMALDEVTTGFDSDPIAIDCNSLFNMDPFQQQLQEQQQQVQSRQPMFSQNTFLQSGANNNKRIMPLSVDVTANTPNKRARIAAKEDDDSKAPRFRPYQEKQWVEQFDELLKFKEERGHCLVPHTFEENPTLSRWVKRQRYQYKLKQEFKPSTMTDARIVKLEKVGFVWDSHAAAWEERRNELAAYKAEYGDCNVPSNYPQNPQLATWVKCQRRQCKLFWCGKTSNMTADRFASLNQLGFTWELRHGSTTSTKMAAQAMGNLSY
ncbi:unnamed protein product [Cylindrotheca closterium]|uniref:Helicase-associated domain-containing protein n=1 Tax=Cylindrotheca closterium TaxID=2856 RepID=A0AAD2JNW7_9STRA|nr:unnamed protein product [Cylindrotheca closterium]